MPKALNIFELILILALLACFNSNPLLGTVLDPMRQAPPFQLRNHLGHTVSFSDYERDVVLLTFMYTQCGDTCPIIASRIRDVHRMLAADAAAVDFVVISVDPIRDTVHNAYEFSERWEMLDDWDFLVGEAEQLRPIWDAYYIDPVLKELSVGDQGYDLGGVYGALESYYDVNHSSPVYLIDRDRDMRVIFTLPMNSLDIVHDIRTILN